MVAAKTPDVALGVGLEHRGRSAPDLVDVIDLPRGVVQERDRCLLNEHVVVVGRTAHERSQTRDGVADLEPDALLKEPLREFLVGRAEDDVAELARPYGALTLDAGRTALGACVDARGVVRRWWRRCLIVPIGDLDQDKHSRAGVDRPDTAFGAIDIDVHGGQ